jgi:hypothetical protein
VGLKDEAANDRRYRMTQEPKGSVFAESRVIALRPETRVMRVGSEERAARRSASG